ncbi:SDR family NAD(P)-dependent oxidoreductase [Marinomonas sp. 15G1-11]|uniref:SDR family NAD(P)-dependent oxidoreductase n=1 Tax=Marinomonas phaeophyticola TaxID=3004091 RepID=A0ABT4JZK4_9GAMM|nr:SDR family oxidoreductase [Marinomonas sp. 15G1-11]MCZ2722954.1 SDR family NAD(P)-dependent oxidoreductase [Marinomonas sp. 15G1-11]
MPNVLITGGNKGLGFIQTKKFLDMGFTVFVVARTLGDLAQLSQKMDSGDLVFIEHDLSGWQDTSYLDKVFEKTQDISALINNAGVHLKKPAWEIEDIELDNILNINVKSVIKACGRYVELQKDRGGSIINISSMAGLIALPNSAAYVTSKTAVIGLTRSIAVDAALFGIRCNAVCPGFIATDMTDAILKKDPERREKILGRIPTRKFGTAQNVADACYFLASPESTYINGVALPVDAGYSIGF